MFQYKTRGNANPQGKQKVYFTCHPDDFGRHFEKISDQILDFENCAVWYSDSEEDYQDIEMELGGMKLLVIPVTTKLLTTSNRTVDKELPFALKKHIAVLPLMQENGLDELFNMKFGSVHYLNENARDDTATPYEEKLKRYLSSIIVGDELAEKVRAAFEAYIFLSYRKKDRKHAQELMRLIHKNDFCRDIAIWYDEFLKPGENFNSAIEDALKKSELFALVVTPNLVNEQNYVQSTEYPLARDAKKKILPAEFVNTDHKKLSQMYPDIPGCVDARNSVQLSEMLLDSLRSIAKAENDCDPQHKFLIGLAYLNGIDVEIDTKRAKDLITASAEAGLNEAAERLVFMYQNGDGVERDYLKAIEWQRKLAGQLRSAYISSGSLPDGKKLIIALWNLGDYLYEIRSLSEAESAYGEMESISLKFSLRRELAVSYGRLGGIRRVRGNLSEAEAYYKKCLELREELAQETKTEESRRELSLSYNSLGDIRQAQGNLLEAEAYYKKSLELSEELVQENQVVECGSVLSVSYNRLGLIRKEQGKLSEAEAYCRKGLELNEALAQETKSTESYRDMAVNYLRLGVIREEHGNHSEAETYFKKGMELFEELVRETKTVTSRHGLALSYENLGDIRQVQGNHLEAEVYYKKGMELFEELARETKTLECRHHLTISYNKFGDICQVKGNLMEAEAYYQKSLKLTEVLAQETKTVEYRLSLAMSYDRLGVIRQAQENYLEAEVYCKKYLELIEVLAQERKTIETSLDLAIGYEKLGDIRQAQGNLLGAEAYYKRGMELFEKLAQETKTVECRRSLAIGYEKLGDINRAQGNHLEAEAYYKKEMELFEELAQETKTVQSYDDLGYSYFKCSMVKNPPDKAFLKQAYQVYDALAEQNPDIRAFAQNRDNIQRHL